MICRYVINDLLKLVNKVRFLGLADPVVIHYPVKGWADGLKAVGVKLTASENHIGCLAGSRNSYPDVHDLILGQAERELQLAVDRQVLLDGEVAGAQLVHLIVLGIAEQLHAHNLLVLNQRVELVVCLKRQRLVLIDDLPVLSISGIIGKLDEHLVLGRDADLHAAFLYGNLLRELKRMVAVRAFGSSSINSFAAVRALNLCAHRVGQDSRSLSNCQHRLLRGEDLFLAVPGAQHLADKRYAGGASDQKYAVDCVNGIAGLLKELIDKVNGALHERTDHLLEPAAGKCHLYVNGISVIILELVIYLDRDRVVLAERLLRTFDLVLEVSLETVFVLGRERVYDLVQIRIVCLSGL